MAVVILILTTFLWMSCWNEISGLEIITEPNETTISFTGSNQTFTWNFNLTLEEKSKQPTVIFAHWRKEGESISGYHWVTVIRESYGSESVKKYTEALITRRLQWVGDLARGFVAFQLLNVQLNDSSDYGIRFCIDRCRHLKESGFTLFVQDPPPSPTRPPEPENITLEIKEGEPLNITCRARMRTESTSVMWLKDNRLIKKGRNRFLFIQSINKSQAGSYMCVSMSQFGDHSPSFTAVDVLYAPKIINPNKKVALELTRGNSTRLKCAANANPSPTFTWYTHDGEITQGFSHTSNSSSLIVTPINERDFTSYICLATNKIANDSVTFTLHEKGKYNNSLVTISILNGRESLTKYLSITAGLAVIAIFALFIKRYMAKRSRGQTNQRTREVSLRSQATCNEFFPNGACNVSSSSDPEWEIPRARLNVEKVIGRGAFGVVSRGLAFDLPGKPGWTVVAVKSVQDDASEKEKADLLSEMSLLKHLDPHPHVIRLYGCVTIEARPLVVVEYAQYGDLLGYLRKSRGVRDNYYSDPSVEPRTSLTSKQLLRFAWQISDGMDYLSKKKIIHRDLAARNVLVGDEDVCKITDFGMARDVWAEDIYVRTHEGRLPIKWTAPEALFGSGAYTTRSDVWSFGVVMYEIFTVGGDPFPGVYMRDIPAMLKNEYRMPRPKFVSAKLFKIMMECWKTDPLKRPDFECLRSRIHSMTRDEEQDYVNLEGLLYENVQPTSFTEECSA
nr:fibroblast growth factor receptor 3-like [Pocillopora verrucosa]